MTTEPNPAHVSQMAREAAAALWPAFNSEIMLGKFDKDEFVQAFARFEQAIRSTQVGEDSDG